MSNLMPKRWEKASEAQRQKMADELTEEGFNKLPEGHIAHSYRTQNKSLSQSNPEVAPSTNPQSLINCLRDPIEEMRDKAIATSEERTKRGYDFSIEDGRMTIRASQKDFYKSPRPSVVAEEVSKLMETEGVKEVNFDIVGDETYMASWKALVGNSIANKTGIKAKLLSVEDKIEIQLEKARKNPDEISVIVDTNKYLTAEALEEMNGLADHYGKMSIASHKNTSPALLDKLADEEDSIIKTFVAANENSSPKTLERLFKMPARNEYITDLLSNKNCPASVLKALEAHPSRIYKRKIAKHPNTPKKILERYKTFKDFWIRAEAGNNLHHRKKS